MIVLAALTGVALKPCGLDCFFSKRLQYTQMSTDVYRPKPNLQLLNDTSLNTFY